VLSSKNYLKISGFFAAKNTPYSNEALFISGGQSDYIQAKDTGLIQQYFPEASIEILDSSGHLPHVEDASRFYCLSLGGLKPPASAGCFKH